jgi:hypothetical protein
MANSDGITPFYPDSTDTEDTLQYLDGADSIILYSDTLSGFFRSDMTVSLPITIQFGNNMGTVTRGVYGINTSGMFDVGTLPNEAGSEYGWQYLIDLAPEVLRFPSGANAKFMHLLHYANGNETQGYGYDIFEIARYYDYTDGTMHLNHSELTAEEINDLLYGDESISEWIEVDKYEAQYKTMRQKYFQDQCASTRYIDDFIELVQAIDAAYPERPKVRVLLCLNIFSETATEARTIADYLRTNGVNVAGIEMGNETYANIFCDMLGFQEFDDYYQYVQGTTSPDHANFMTSTMNLDHDYISAFKPSVGYNYPLGICGIPLGAEYAFRTSATCTDVVNWNSDLKVTYNDKIDGTKFKYNAVILHTYNEPDNWSDIPINNLTPHLTCSNPTDDLWDFTAYDADLEGTYDGVLGVGDLPGNFQAFLKKNTTGSLSYQESMDAFNDIFEFSLPTNSGGKFLWNTEWNLKDGEDDGNDYDAETVIPRIYSNGFTHGHLLFNWWLKNIKINFHNEYRPGFLQYATVQNYAGGSSIDLVSLAKTFELEYYNLDICPYIPDEACDDDCEPRNYYIRRTTWFTTYLLSTIWKENLKYLRSTYLVPHSDEHNVAPTSFIDANKENLYVFYSNAKELAQEYQLASFNLAPLFPEAAYVGFGPATLTYLSADQAYSTSGRSELFNNDFVNACYNNNNTPFEIKADGENTVYPAIQTIDNDPDCTGSYETNGCLTAPKYSFGYFKIPIITGESPLKQAENNPTDKNWQLYANPAGSSISISSNAKDQSPFGFVITNALGTPLQQGMASPTQAIIIDQLAAGYYICSITDTIGTTQHISFFVYE